MKNMPRKKNLGADMKNPIKVIRYYYLKKAQRKFNEIKESEKTKSEANNCHMIGYVWYDDEKIFQAQVVCNKNIYDVEVEFMGEFDEEDQVINYPVKLYCECPFFIWNGPIYNLNQVKSLRHSELFPGKNIFPKIRDPQTQNPLCKHLTLVKNHLKGKTFKNL